MFFRFASAVVLVVLVSLAGIALEKQNLDLRRTVAAQHYQVDALLESHARLRLRAQELGAPERLIEALEQGKLDLERPKEAPEIESRQMPLLHWQRAPETSPPPPPEPAT